MGIGINDFRMAIRIDNTEAKQKLVEMKDTISSLRGELKQMEADGKKDDPQYKEKLELYKKLNGAYNEHKKVVGLTGLTYDELRKGARTLKAQMERSIPGSEKWIAYRDELIIVENRMKTLRMQSDATSTSITKATNGVGKYAAIGAGAIASLTGMAMAARKYVDEFAQMQEAESQVRKYTGMTTEEVATLNEEFKKMDTRTARTRLNELAGEAGRLGMTGKQDVLEFVEAANMIDVALGEDLGEDGIKNIGKLAQMFGDSSRSMKDNMLAIGSSVNEVAQNSSAAEPYLVEFTARMGGVAKQAKLSVTDVMGFASALDQNMLRSEMASTALQGLILKLYQEPAKYAKLAGMDVEQFTKLMETDANEAMLAFLGSLGKLGSMDKMAPVLKEMKLSGAEAAGVISALAGNVEKVRKEQETANQAFIQGTSIVNEYSIQNSTVQAELDKAKKHFADIRVELGERLMPLMKHMISTGSMTVKGLSAVVKVMMEYKGALLTAAGMVAAYTVAVKAQYLWTMKLKDAKVLSWLQDKKQLLMDKAMIAGTALLNTAKYTLTGNIARATVAMRAFNTATKGNLLGMLAALAIGAGVAIYKLATRTTDAEKAVHSFLEESEKERRALRNLIDTTKVAGDKTQRRKELIEEINSKYGQYLPNLLSEFSSLKDIEQAYRDINKAMDQNLARKVLNEKETEIKNDALKDQISEMNDIREMLEGTLPQSQINDYVQKLTVATESCINAGNSVENTTKTVLKKLNNYYSDKSEIPTYIYNQLEDYVQVVEKTAKKVKSVRKEMLPFIGDDKPKSTAKKGYVSDEVIIVAKDLSKSGGGTNNEDKKKGNPWDAEMKQLELKSKQEQNKKKKQLLEDEKYTEDTYKKEMYVSEISFLASKKTLLEKYGQDSSEVQGQIYDKMIAETNRANKEKNDAEKKSKEDTLKNVDSAYEADKVALKQRYLNGEIKNEKDFQQQMKVLELTYLEERKKALEKWGEDTTKISAQIQDVKLGLHKDATEKLQKEEESAKEKAKKDFYDRTDSQFANAVIDGLQLIFANEKQIWESEEEYLERMKNKKIAAFAAMEMAAAAASNAISVLQDREISKISIKYDKEIKAARKAGKDTTKLEEQKEIEVNEVRKKYADKQFAATALQIVATTAMAAIQAYNAVVGIVPVGPILAPIAAGAALASGMAQLAVAKQARDEAKGLKTGGYSDEYVQGYTASGNPDDTAGVIPVHKNEFVTNHEGVANPHVRQFLDVFDIAQKNGTIKMLNTTQILEHIRTRTGKYSGGWTNEESSGTSSTKMVMQANGGMNNEQLVSKVLELMRDSNRLLDIISKKELNIDSRKVRDGIRRVDQLERNVSR